MSPTTATSAELDRIATDGERLRDALQALSGAARPEPSTDEESRLGAEARRWMELEEAFRLRTDLRLGLREMEHFEEVAYLQGHEAPAPEWRRLLVLKIGFRLERLAKLRPQLGG